MAATKPKASAKQKRAPSKKRKSKKQTTPLAYEIAGIGFIALSLITIFQLGPVGRALTTVSTYLVGNFQLLLPVSVIAISLYLVIYRTLPDLTHRVAVGIFLILGSIFLFSHVLFFDQLAEEGLLQSSSAFRETHQELIKSETTNVGAGMTGALLYAVFHFLFASTGSKIAAIALLMAGIILMSGRSLGSVIKAVVTYIATWFKDTWLALKEELQDKRDQKKEQKKAEQIARRSGKQQAAAIDPDQTSEGDEKDELILPREDDSFEPLISSFAEKVTHEEPKKPEPEAPQKEEQEIDIDKLADAAAGVVEVENKDYILPKMDILSLPPHADQSNEYKAIQKNASKLEKTFQSFGVRAKVTQVHLGPAVTKYEVHPDVGVKVSKIVNLNDDLALALAAKDIRIEAPIPGKSAIGIEVPNSEVAMVSLREVLEAQSKDRDSAKLLIGLGRDITGEAVVAELNKMPHLLVAGATGSGKSVCINGIIISILMRTKPHEVKLMMIDPKMVELNVYNGVPHLLAPVVTDPKKASQALKKVVSEMERRYDLFSHTGTRNIEGYNDHVKRFNDKNEEKQPLLPYIVVIVDELADLMMVASNDVEDAITRLAQMARAAGIHLIIATQRPSVDVITGVIKANIPSRIAFAVSSQIDSRTILDSGGAEKLLGRGDMLFMPIGANKPVRVQGAFLSDQEVEEVVNFVIEQQKAQYQEEMIPEDIPEKSVNEVEDELYDEAVSLIIEMQTASVSMLQRRFRVGYTRAARLIDAMEDRGVVGPYEGSKPRAVLVSRQPEDSGSQM
ncbi:FtsK/SpoIIIE family DNA translocase [Jeotgalibacillus proteolyticus]|uniref:Cell division protein FtsK n=1 Tax=Jeotgalibacillus proteolyticus TaxID=2082395 RepID=A0A2S5GHM6_9BACL|nr:DNA translocase FtsK [Jeotgalibacillus proteolyticus]PPA72476.1 cell division protein FtsK [Jeotgalibacillus proteolyticus]